MVKVDPTQYINSAGKDLNFIVEHKDKQYVLKLSRARNNSIIISDLISLFFFETLFSFLHNTQ